MAGAAQAPARRRAAFWVAGGFFGDGLGVLYASSDEIHQAFVPNRDARVLDVLIDSAGAVAGMGLLWVFWWFRNTTKVKCET